MRTRPNMTVHDLEANLSSLGQEDFCIRMAVGILLTPTGDDRLLADVVSDFVHLPDDGRAFVDWPGITAALDAGDLVVCDEHAQLVHLAAVLATNRS